MEGAAAPTVSPDPPAIAKPRLRGMLHAVAFPVSLVTGTVLVAAVARGAQERVGSAVYALSCSLLFGVSALYHRGHWNARTQALLRRLDHSNIFVLIAGTYTPVSLALLEGTARTAVLAVVWTGALAGVAFRVLWLSAPHWFYTPCYVALGWVAVTVMPELAHNGGAAVAALLVAGGLAYSLGAVAYALRRPNPVPGVFGYHEVFHTGTLVGFACHYAAVVLALT